MKMYTIDQHDAARRVLSCIAMALFPVFCFSIAGCATAHEESRVQPDETMATAGATRTGGDAEQMDPAAEWAESMNASARKIGLPPSRFRATPGADGSSIIICGDREALKQMQEAATKPLDEVAKGGAKAKN
jgi:hypothetical protein